MSPSDKIDELVQYNKELRQELGAKSQQITFQKMEIYDLKRALHKCRGHAEYLSKEHSCPEADLMLEIIEKALSDNTRPQEDSQ